MKTASPKKDRPMSVPYPIRFPDQTLLEVDATAAMFAMSRQDVIRLSVAAGLVAMRRMGSRGLAEAMADLVAETASPRPEPI